RFDSVDGVGEVTTADLQVAAVGISDATQPLSAAWASASVNNSLALSSTGTVSNSVSVLNMATTVSERTTASSTSKANGSVRPLVAKVLPPSGSQFEVARAQSLDPAALGTLPGMPSTGVAASNATNGQALNSDVVLVRSER